MESATEKQIMALKKFARNRELSKGILKGIEFKDLDKQHASDLITQCINQNGNTYNGKDQDKVRSYQDFKDAHRLQRTTTLTDEEILNIRDAHKRHCKEILNECRDEYPGEPEVQIAFFDKRCDKIYSWIQQARDQKIREQRMTSA